MRTLAKYPCRAVLICGAALVFSGFTGNLNAQQAGAQVQTQTQGRADIASFDAFLDAHTDIDAQLRANPSLLNDAEYLRTHLQLRAFLDEHPQIREQARLNAESLVRRQNRFDAREQGESRRDRDFDASRDRDRRANPNPDLTQQEIASMDQFLDSHPDVARDLRRNPDLVNDNSYLRTQHDLDAYLDAHPAVKEELKETPTYFMHRENRFEASERDRDMDRNRTGRRNPNPDLTQQEIASMDQFLDSHPDVARDLRRNPDLVNDNSYLRTQHDLDAFLDAHPAVKEELKETPTYFMHRENRFEASERDRDMDRNRTGRRNPNPDLTRQEIASMDQFLDSHPDVARDLRRNPDLVNDNNYLRQQHDLDAFLDAHPAVKEELKETPTYFMRRENRFEASERDRDMDREQINSRNSARVTNQEAVSLDQFLDRHEDIAKSLEKKPELLNDRGYLKRHKDLDEFLEEHPALREQARENPSLVLRSQNRLEARNMDRDDIRDRDTRGADVDRDMDKKEIKELDHFLDKHKSIDKDLEKNPSLINDNDYLKHHKSLEAFLRKNPDVGVELKNNPSTLMHRQERMERNHRINQPATKEKSRLEQKEQTRTPTPH
jgi:phage-related protein